MIVDEQSPVLGEGFKGAEVTILATRDTRVDGHFRRNYAWAKHAADRGRLKKITVVVAVGDSDVAHAVQAVRSALSGEVLHAKARFYVRTEGSGFTPLAGQVLDAISPWETTEVEAPKRERKERVKPVEVEVEGDENGEDPGT